MEQKALPENIKTFLTFQATASGGKHASIKSKYSHQLVTSSTLKWQHSSKSDLAQSVPDLAVRSVSDGKSEHVICRAEHHGTLLVGQTVPGGTCAVPFVNKIHK